ncbi:multiple coagulation factor deficiency protein 2 homolog [Parasteatoda tepidariorum]|uniref:multiple coagulation factor deficiency protein 2 homolog n=1 Tax=Parasteatoda tepidariorum TaxID=114398 RepID=UPI001C71EA0B|nr:multiple coagulation factor deficiency protein 2 homolog [Parasteatoda tepidariorum]
MIWRFLILTCLPFSYAKINESKRKLKVDKEHLKFDFADIFGPLTALFTDDKMDFQYFAVHDYDSNNKLDGLELFIALGHESDHEHHDSKTKEKQNEDIERQIDDIFQDHDRNDDGFLDFREFLSVQRDYPDLAGEGKVSAT